MPDINLHIENLYPGAEMLPYERLKLYNWIVEIIKPENNILETGCGHGGGTYYISEAVREVNPKAKIYTCDPGRGPSDDFLKIHTNVDYRAVYSDNLIYDIIKNNIKLDYLFFDGPEDPNIAMNDIRVLEDYISPGCYFSMHDWETTPRKYDNGLSTKAALIRPYMEHNPSIWEPIEVLDGINSDQSVGLCLYKFLGK